MAKEISVIIADDHSVVRAGIAAILDFADGITVAGEAADGLRAVNLAKSLSPDVVIMDLMMPKMNGSDATARIVAECPGVKVLILTTYGSSEDIRKALDNGATGAIMKTTTKQQLVSAIRSVAAGKRVIGAEIETTLNADTPIPDLTDRQMQILQSVARGLSNNDIATQLDISRSCVKQHLLAIFQKLGVATRAEAVSIAFKKQLMKD